MGQGVNQSAMEETFAKLTNRSVVPGSNKSLLDVGYAFANLDDGWQACGQGVNGGFHDKDGVPLMDPKKFPDVSAMTAKPHSLGLKSGFYVNNYICGGGDCSGGSREFRVGGAGHGEKRCDWCTTQGRAGEVT